MMMLHASWYKAQLPIPCAILALWFNFSVGCFSIRWCQVEINEAWKMKKVLDPTILPKGKSHGKKDALTLPENEETNIGEIEQSLQFSNATTTTGFQQTASFVMRLNSVNETYIGNGATEEDPSQLHQADAENITLFERFDSFQTNADAYNRFERWYSWILHDFYICILFFKQHFILSSQTRLKKTARRNSVF